MPIFLSLTHCGSSGLRLGISPIGWSNDDLPESDGDIPLDACLAEARGGTPDAT